MSTTPTNAAFKKIISNNITDDYIQLIRGSDKKVLLWVDASGIIQGANGAIGGTIGGSIAVNQVAVGTGSNTIGGSTGLTYLPGDLSIVSAVGSAELKVTPSTGVAFETQIQANSDGSTDILSGTCTEIHLLPTEVLLSPAPLTINPLVLKFTGSSSGQAGIGVSTAAGSAHDIYLPQASGAAGQMLITDGNNPQQTSWTNSLPFVTAPVSASAAGTTGQVAFDSTHFYVCIATNTWVRTTLATW